MQINRALRLSLLDVTRQLYVDKLKASLMDLRRSFNNTTLFTATIDACSKLFDYFLLLLVHLLDMSLSHQVLIEEDERFKSASDCKINYDVQAKHLHAEAHTVIVHLVSVVVET